MVFGANRFLYKAPEGRPFGRDGRFGRYFLNLIACTDAYLKQTVSCSESQKDFPSEWIGVEKKRPKRPWRPYRLPTRGFRWASYGPTEVRACRACSYKL